MVTNKRTAGVASLGIMAIVAVVLYAQRPEEAAMMSKDALVAEHEEVITALVQDNQALMPPIGDSQPARTVINPAVVDHPPFFVATDQPPMPEPAAVDVTAPNYAEVRKIVYERMPPLVPFAPASNPDVDSGQGTVEGDATGADTTAGATTSQSGSKPRCFCPPPHACFCHHPPANATWPPTDSPTPEPTASPAPTIPRMPPGSAGATLPTCCPGQEFPRRERCDRCNLCSAQCAQPCYCKGVRT